MTELLLGIDIGTSSCKVAAFDLDGNVVASEARQYPIYYPKPSYVEQDVLDWWREISACIKGITSKLNPQDIKAIGIDGQSWSCIPIDRRGNVLYRNPIWQDNRSEEICKKIKRQIDEDKIVALCGNPFQPSYTTPKILWFKENEPEVYNNTYKFLQSNSYIAYCLTGELSQDICQSYGLHNVNIATGEYDEEMTSLLGLDIDKLIKNSRCHDIIGSVTQEASEQTGLLIGTKVVAGGLDAACGTLGAGVYKAGQTQEQGGQAGGMSICTKNSKGNKALILSRHVIPDLWLLQGGTVAGGASLEWFCTQLGGTEELEQKKTGVNKFKLIDEMAEKVNAGSDGMVFLPYLQGERSPIWDTNAKGVFYGLDFSKTKAHFYRSVLEGVAFSLKHNLDCALEAGAEVSELYSMGGAANSRLWTQIKADVTSREFIITDTDTATTQGAAILAGVGIGLYKDFGEAVNRVVRIKRRQLPNERDKLVYEKTYEVYLKLYENLKDTMKIQIDTKDLI